MFVGWRDLKFAKGRFAVIGAVIVLLTMLVGLLSGLTAGLAAQNVSAITSLPVQQLVFAKPSGDAAVSFAQSSISRQQYRQWQSATGDRAEPLGISTTRAGNPATAVTAGVSVFGVRPGSPLAPDPARHLDQGQTVLSAAAAEDLGVGIGSQVQIGGRTLTVAAVAGDAYYSHTPVVWTDLAVWQGLSAAQNGAAYATVLGLGEVPADVLASTDAAAGTVSQAPADSLSAIGSYTSENGSLQLIRGLLLVISAMVMAAFFAVWTMQRQGDVAVLKAMGAATGALLRDALGQALVLLVAGAAVGTSLVVAIGAALSATAMPFELTVATAVLPALAMVLLGAVGAALSVRKITSVDPLTALGATR